MIGFNWSVFGIDRSPFYEREKIALYALSWDVSSAGIWFSGNFIYLVDENNTVVFHRGDCFFGDGVIVQQFVAFFVD